MARKPVGAKRKRAKTKRAGYRAPRPSAPSRRAAPVADGWNSVDGGVRVERDSAGRVTAIWHPTYPFVEPAPAAVDDITALLPVASRYLAANKDLLALPDWWLADLGGTRAGSKQTARIRLDWLTAKEDPRCSFWSQRDSEDGIVDRSAILIAGLTAPSGGSRQTRPLFGGQGLRVVAHVARDTVAITGVSTSLPSWANDLAAAQWIYERLFDIDPTLHGRRRADVGAVLRNLGSQSLRLFGLSGETGTAQNGMILPDRWSPAPGAEMAFYLRVNSGAAIGEHAEAISYSLVTRHTAINPSRKKGKVAWRVEPVFRDPLIAFATLDAKVLKQDPVSLRGRKARISLRPNRSWRVLDACCATEIFHNLAPGATANTVKLDDPSSHFTVTNSRYVAEDKGKPEDAPKELPAVSHDHVRTDRFAAVSAYYHAHDLFERMKQYHLAPSGYFRFVGLPIRVRYRAGIIPGSTDGQTVNAQVRWLLEPVLAPGSFQPGTVEVCFALADMQSSSLRAPLGMAADPRWTWHEYCHVLLMAALGEKEFPFAHSAGDAMAAIVCDPKSALGVDEVGQAENDSPWRGVTFPWVSIGRRHDRDVAAGWSWSGAIFGRDAFFQHPGSLGKRGYAAEQILSTTLFRLYRAIGGDTLRRQGGHTVPAVTHRSEAADYALYLIMRGIQMLGPSTGVPAYGPAQFMEALVQADRATWPSPGRLKYAGGAVGKLIQWAFMWQGLYGNPVPGSLVCGPEDPSRVDLHIDDRRAQRIGPYTPIDFLSGDWLAAPQAVDVQGPHTAGNADSIRITVKNRGPDPANNVTVQVWAARMTTAEPPLFPNAAWVLVGTVPAQGGVVPGAQGQTPGVATFGPLTWTPPAAGRYALLAVATCPDDRANLDSATGLPCAVAPGAVALKYVVASDNNLALDLIDIA